MNFHPIFSFHIAFTLRLYSRNSFDVQPPPLFSTAFANNLPTHPQTSTSYSTKHIADILHAKLPLLAADYHRLLLFLLDNFEPFIVSDDCTLWLLSFCLHGRFASLKSFHPLRPLMNAYTETGRGWYEGGLTVYKRTGLHGGTIIAVLIGSVCNSISSLFQSAYTYLYNV